MTQLLEKAFTDAKKLSNDQDEIAHQLLVDIKKELEWQETSENPDV